MYREFNIAFMPRVMKRAFGYDKEKMMQKLTKEDLLDMYEKSKEDYLILIENQVAQDIEYKVRSQVLEILPEEHRTFVRYDELVACKDKPMQEIPVVGLGSGDERSYALFN